MVLRLINRNLLFPYFFLFLSFLFHYFIFIINLYLFHLYRFLLINENRKLDKDIDLFKFFVILHQLPNLQNSDFFKGNNVIQGSIQTRCLS